MRPEGLEGADGEEAEAIEGQPGDAELVGQVFHPREHEVGDDAIGWVLLHEVLDGPAEHDGAVVDLADVGGVGVGGDALDAVGKAHFLGRKLDGVDGEVGVVGDGVVDDSGVGRGGDDGHVVAT